MAIHKTTSVVLFEEKKDASTKKTIVVFGVTRGGTSMVAGAVRGFGVFLGDNLPVNNEDANFTYKPLPQMKETIKKRNENHDIWGWKFPMASNYLEELIPLLVNPHFVIVCRDVAATAGALTRWHNRDVSAAISEALIQTQKNFTLALRWQLPTLFVSYERAATDSKQFLSELSLFLKLDLAVDQDKVIQFMERGSYKSFEEIIYQPLSTK